jgi:hypothetical protein
MKLKEIINNGWIRDLALQFLDAQKSGNQKEINKAVSMIATQTLAKGWVKTYTVRFLDQLQSVDSESDVYTLLSKYDAIKEESPIDRINTFKAAIGISIIEKDNVKSEVKQLVNYMKKKDMKVIKAKVGNSTGFKLPGSETETIDISVNVIFKTKMERDDLYRVLEPKYEVFELEEK